MSAPVSIPVRTASAAYSVEIAPGIVRNAAERMAAAGLRPHAAAVICDTAVEPVARNQTWSSPVTRRMR